MNYTKEEEREFENYVRQYRDIYKTRKNENGIWGIPCKKGNIEPYSHKELCCYQEFKNRLGINTMKDKLPKYCEITQETATGLVFKFPNQRLKEIAEIVKAKKRRHLSPEHREKILANLKPYANQNPKNTEKTGGFDG